MNALPVRAILAALLLAATGSVHAHPGHDSGEGGGFIAGLLHPLTGADHLLALLAIGLWGGVSARQRHERAGTAALPLALFAAGAAWSLSAALPALPEQVFQEQALAFSVLVLGLLVATRQRLLRGASVLLVGLFALLHGGAHDHDWRGFAQPATLAAGTVTATAALAVGSSLGHALRDAGHWARRAAGGVVAAAGLLLMASA